LCRLCHAHYLVASPSSDSRLFNTVDFHFFRHGSYSACHIERTAINEKTLIKKRLSLNLATGAHFVFNQAARAKTLEPTLVFLCKHCADVPFSRRSEKSRCSEFPSHRIFRLTLSLHRC